MPVELKFKYRVSSIPSIAAHFTNTYNVATFMTVQQYNIAYACIIYTQIIKPTQKPSFGNNESEALLHRPFIICKFMTITYQIILPVLAAFTINVHYLYVYDHDISDDIACTCSIYYQRGMETHFKGELQNASVSHKQ